MDQRRQRHPLVVCPDHPAVGLRGLVYAERPFRAIPHDRRDGPPPGRFQQQGGAAGRGQAHLLLPGLRGLIGEPCRHGQPGGRGDRRGHRRAGRRVLDVADRPAGLVERVCRVDAGPTL